jgi:hypothetical protein
VGIHLDPVRLHADPAQLHARRCIVGYPNSAAVKNGTLNAERLGIGQVVATARTPRRIRQSFIRCD